MIDGLVVVHARNYVHVRVPLGVFLLHHATQKFNVAAREQIKPTIDIHDALARSGGYSRHERIARFGARCVHEDGGAAANDAIRIRRVCLYALEELGGLGRGALGVWVNRGQQDATEIAQVVRLGTQQHAADEVGGGDPGRALDDFEARGGFDDAVAVFTGGIGGDIVAVDDEGAAVLVHPVRIGDVGGAGDREVGPLAGGNSSHAFAHVHDGGAFVFEDLFVRVNADNEILAELLGLEHGAGVA